MTVSTSSLTSSDIRLRLVDLDAANADVRDEKQRMIGGAHSDPKVGHGVHQIATDYGIVRIHLYTGLAPMNS